MGLTIGFRDKIIRRIAFPVMFHVSAIENPGSTPVHKPVEKIADDLGDQKGRNKRKQDQQ